MKELSRCIIAAFVLLLSAFVVDAYISPPHGAWDPNQHFQRKRQQQQKQQPVDNPSTPKISNDNMAEPASNVQVEDIFRSEYREWGLRYGKKIDFGNEERFKNFQLVSQSRVTKKFTACDRHIAMNSKLTYHLCTLAFRTLCCRCSTTRRPAYSTF